MWIIIVIFVFIVVIAILKQFDVLSYEQKEKRENKKQELQAEECVSLRHVAGLPLAENCMCNLYLCKDKIVIESEGATFNLLKEKLIDVNLKTETEIRKAYVSSVGGAVGGALLFGPLGAMIGGRTKEKEDKTEKQFLIFTYLKDNQNQYISFEITREFSKALKFIKDFRDNAKQEKKEFNL